MAEHEPEQFRACGVCGRTILKGERLTEYLTPDGAVEPVCALCRTRAEEAGWVLTGSPEAQALPPPARRRRSLRGLRLRERAARAGARVRRPPPQKEPEEPSAAPRAPRPRKQESRTDEGQAPPPRRQPAPEATREAEEPADTPEQRIRRALECFNASEETRRVVSGLTRSLGKPKAAVQETTDEPGRLEVTVAWDLSWYRWEVGVNGEDAPRQVAQGDGAEELESEGIDWNAHVDGQGRLRWPKGS